MAALRASLQGTAEQKAWKSLTPNKSAEITPLPKPTRRRTG